MKDTINDVVTGEYMRAIYDTDDHSFSVYEYKLDSGNRVAVVGTEIPGLPRVTVNLYGEWVQNKKTGKQQFRYLYYDIPKSVGRKAVTAYLQTLKCGIGGIRANLIYEKFKDNTWDIIESNPDRLTEVCGVTKRTVNRLKRAMLEGDVNRQLIKLTSEHGIKLKPSQVKAIIKQFGEKTMLTVKEHPYQLSYVRGVSFDTADGLALSLGFKEDDPERLRASVLKILGEQSRNGNVCIPYEMAINNMCQLLRCTQDAAKKAWHEALESKHAVYRGGMIFQKERYEEEDRIAKGLMQLLYNSDIAPIETIDTLIADYEKRNISLAPAQREAVKTVFQKNVCIITGGPGTGKTTVSKAILTVHQMVYGAGSRPILLAPTGRAAKRMSEATGYPAQTIHSAVGYRGDDVPIDDLTPLDGNLIIVDETSMMDQFIADVLLQKIPDRARLVLVGDPDQLPSVGCGNILKDMLTSEVIPTVRLRVIFRQAKGNPIVSNSYKINHGQTDLEQEARFTIYEQSDARETFIKACKLYQACVKRYGNLDDVILLNPQRHNTELSVENFNIALQRMLNPPKEGKRECQYDTTLFREGDRVMQLRNTDFAKNGDIGYIISIDDAVDPDDGTLIGKQVMVRFDDTMHVFAMDELDQLDLAYCSTVHKAQGEQYETVIMVVSNAHPAMLRRNLVYTGITRAKENVMIVGEKSALDKAIQDNRTDDRWTLLAQRLRYYSKVREA